MSLSCCAVLLSPDNWLEFRYLANLRCPADFYHRIDQGFLSISNRSSSHCYPPEGHLPQHDPGCPAAVPGGGWSSQHDLCVAERGRECLPHRVSLVYFDPVSLYWICVFTWDFAFVMMFLMWRLLYLNVLHELCVWMFKFCFVFRPLKSRVKIMVDGTLLITRITPDDSGNYTCIPTNGLLTPPTASASLTVRRECLCADVFISNFQSPT